MKWADKKNYKLEIISEHRGDEAGIKSSTIKICGSMFMAGSNLNQEYID
jgi:protein subunit release factor B